MCPHEKLSGGTQKRTATLEATASVSLMFRWSAPKDIPGESFAVRCQRLAHGVEGSPRIAIPSAPLGIQVTATSTQLLRMEFPFPLFLTV